MKKLAVFIIALIFIIVGAIIAIPYFFKDEILDAVKKDLNRQLTAQVDFDDVDISLIKHFPDLYFDMKNFRITGTGPRHDLTLAQIRDFGLVLDIMKLFRGEKKVKSVYLDNARFHIYISPDGQANYDIMKETDDESSGETGEGLEMEIEKFIARQVRFLYDDRSTDMKMLIAGLNHEGNIKIDGDVYRLTGNSTADTLDFIFDGVRYLKNVKAGVTHNVELKNGFSTYILNEIKADLNELPIQLRGEVDMKDEGIYMDLAYASEENSLKKFLSLVPDTYMPDLSAMDISGQAILQGDVKGLQNDSLYPAYHVDFEINNGRIKAKDLPESIEKLRVKTLVAFPGGKNLDATTIDLPDIRFSLADNFARGNLFIRNPMTDPLVKTAFKSDLDLGKFKRALPLEGIKKLEGLLKADFSVNGRVSAMEKQQYDKIQAKGYLNLKNFAFETDSLPYPVRIPNAETRFTPQALRVENTRILAGKSDFEINGEINNYLTYALQKDSTLEAAFVSRSQLIDFNELSGGNDEEEAEEETATGAPRIPGGLDIDIQAFSKELIFKDMNLKDVETQIRVKDKKAELSTLLMKAFGGEMRMKGLYDTSDKMPYSRLDMILKKARIDRSAQSLSYFNHYAPVLKEVKGVLDLDFGVGTKLDENLNPVFSTTDATGIFQSQNIRPEHVDILKQVSSLLKIKALENPTIDKVQARFEIKKGNLNIKPFNFNINQIHSQLGGSVKLDQTLDLTWDMEIPVEMFGSGAQQWLQNFQSQLQSLGLPLNEIKTVYVTLKITGDMMHPAIKPVFRKGKGKEGLTETVKETVTQVVEDKVEETKAEAEARAQELIREAEEKGDALIREAEAAAERIRAEADKQAKKLVDEAKNPIAKIAAEKAAEKIRKEADKKANKLIEEARKKKQQLIEEARQKAAKIKD